MHMFIKIIIELSIQYPQDCMKGKRPQLKLLDMEFLIPNLYWVILDTGMQKIVAYGMQYKAYCNLGGVEAIDGCREGGKGQL